MNSWGLVKHGVQVCSWISWSVNSVLARRSAITSGRILLLWSFPILAVSGVWPAGGRAASNLKWYNGLILHFIHFLVDTVLWSSTLQMYPLPEAGPREARVGTLDIMHRSAIIWNLVALCWAWNELKLWIIKYIHILSTCFLELFTHPPHYLQFFSLDCD